LIPCYGLVISARRSANQGLILLETPLFLSWLFYLLLTVPADYSRSLDRAVMCPLVQAVSPHTLGICPHGCLIPLVSRAFSTLDMVEYPARILYLLLPVLLTAPCGSLILLDGATREARHVLRFHRFFASSSFDKDGSPRWVIHGTPL